MPIPKTPDHHVPLGTFQKAVAASRASACANRDPVALYVRNSDTHPAKLVKLVATVGPLDIDDPAPAITLMLPDED